MKRSYIIATAFAFLIGAWVLSGQIGQSQSNGDETDVQEGSDTASYVAVKARVFTAEPRTRSLTIRGQTQAIRKVDVRAETSGTVIGLPVEKGAQVAKGDILCELSLNARDAKFAEAEALTRQRWLEYDASKKLAAKGHRSETQAAASKAAYDAAMALLKQREVELGHTKIRAPFDGFVDRRAVEIGDYLQTSGTCATVVDLDPFLVVGQVSEREVGMIVQGGKGTAILITGEHVEGIVRFVGKTSDPATRTFRVELEVPNPDFKLRDGVTAEILVPSGEVMAHRIPTSILSLNDQGKIGVRIVNGSSVVRFAEVAILEDSTAGVWVSGLPERVTLITVGQDFVKSGEKVDITLEPEDGAAT